MTVEDGQRQLVPSQTVLLATLQDALRQARRFADRALDALDLRLEAMRLRADPETAKWITESHRAIADGSFDARVRDQPSPTELAADLKARRR